MLNVHTLGKFTAEERAAIFSKLKDSDIEALLHDWRFMARPEQLPPPGQWRTWMFMGGRGTGKTRTGAEFIREEIKNGAGRVALVGPAAADCREVMVDGESGLLSVCWKEDRTVNGAYLGRPEYQPSRRRLVWANGAVAYCYSAEDPEQLRGPQHDLAWADEFAAWSNRADTWSNLQFGLRLKRKGSTPPRQLVTTTPRPVPELSKVLKRPDTIITRGSTRDNAAFLSDDFLAAVESMYAGTRLGRQELDGELLEDIEGAFWTRAGIDRCRISKDQVPTTLDRVVVAIDPSGAKSDTDMDADEIGIVVAGRAGNPGNGTAYVLADLSMRGGPADWAKVAVNAYYAYNADCIVAEQNFGGALVEYTIKVEDKAVPYKAVTASRGKAVRAEPVSALYEKGRVKHVGALNKLEDQLLLFSSEGYQGPNSPDRADAAVWAVTDLLVRSVGNVQRATQR